MHTDHAALHWLLTIDDTSGRLIRCRLRLAEFDFENKYKKGKINTLVDTLSGLKTAGENIPQYYNDNIPVFHLGLITFELEFNKSPDNVFSIYVQYAEVD